MAVVVQRLVPAEVAGVLFTRDPLDPEGKRMLVEASWGLGESVVSGKVAPDRYHLDRETGGVVEQHIAAKTVQVTAAGTSEVPAEKQTQACLDAARLAELAELGRRVEAFYNEPRDVEWAWAEGRFWLLQARPITAASAAEREQVRREEIAALAAQAEPGGTVWSRYNIPEGMPEPTPMTWALVGHLLSGRGGCGRMYRDLGYGNASGQFRRVRLRSGGGPGLLQSQPRGAPALGLAAACVPFRCPEGQSAAGFVAAAGARSLANGSALLVFAAAALTVHHDRLGAALVAPGHVEQHLRHPLP